MVTAALLVVLVDAIIAVTVTIAPTAIFVMVEVQVQ